MNPGQIYDAYKLMNALASQALGTTNLQAVDTSTFVAVGETVLKSGYENTLKSLGVVLNRTIFSVRPYLSKFWSLSVTPERYGAITRKIINLYSDAEQSQNVNITGNSGYPADPAVNNIANGQSVDMYKINAPKVMQINFYGQQALQKHITRFQHQLDAAFRSENEFMQFVAAYMVEFYNEIEVLNEAKSRAVVLNRIAGQSAMGLSIVDVVAGFNEENATTYTRAELLSASHITEFMQYIAAVIMTYADRLEDMQTGAYHANISGYAPIPRHSPKARQRMLMYNPIFRKAETQVYSGLFNPDYLKIGRFEGVNYWQAQDKPESISLIPSILNTTTGESVAATSAVNLPYVLGILYDEEAMGWTPVYTTVASTPLNANGLYTNTFYHWVFNAYNDFTENAVVFVLGDGGGTAVSENPAPAAEPTATTENPAAEPTATTENPAAEPTATTENPAGKRANKK